MTIFQYLKMVRLEEAKNALLLVPALSLEVIALQTGYYDSAALINDFKKRFGVTPGDFRKTGGRND